MGEKQLHGPPTPGALAARAESRAITKPKIRIVHVVAPEIIQTDAAHFRDLVQRLTGKPTRRDGGGGGRKKAAGAGDVKPEVPSFRDVKAVMGSLQGYRDAQAPAFGERVKVEVEVETDELWMADNPGALFGGLADLDGFMQGLGELPVIPLSASHGDFFGEQSSPSE